LRKCRDCTSYNARRGMGERDQQEDECLAPRSRRTSCDEPNLKAELSQDLAPMKRASKERGKRVSLWFSFWWGK